MKEKWDRMGRDKDDDNLDLTEEKAKDRDRVERLAEEMAAQARMAYDDDTKIWSGAGLRVTDYKTNSRVILPKALSPLEESKLEVLRMELLHQAKEWIAKNCDCKGNQPSNLPKKAQAGVKSLRKRASDGSLAIVPTDKSGRFAVMTMKTYIKAGEVHTVGDEEIGLAELRANQKRVNGIVSMLLKTFNIGRACKHESRWRESTINNSLEVSPMWILYKCHKGWTFHKGTPPPTRGVMGGNQGMNSHLSEIVSWAVEPLADAALPLSSEVISNEQK